MILVTGGAGYIGSHAVRQLQKKGYEVLVLDNFVYGHKDIVENALKVPYVEGDIGDKDLLRSIFKRGKFQAVMHFSAYAYVGESVTDPLKYYQNNIISSINLLEIMRECEIKKFVFSSTCATYGNPIQVPISETHPQNPINPYGFSKLVIEQAIKDFAKAYGLEYVIFRYFNASGADAAGDLGEDHNPETHLIPLLMYRAMEKIKEFGIYGDDYETPDGTCIRDYIHVNDLADAHVLGLEHILNGKPSDIFNLGTGNGNSVKEVLEAARTITGHKIPATIHARREGDPPRLVADSSKAKNILGWNPSRENLKEIVQSAWNWHVKRHSLGN